MARKRRRYTPEFKTEAVSLVINDGLSITQAAKDLGITPSVLSRWVAKARVSETGTPWSELEQENRRLRRQLELAEKERDILKKAAAFFAKETL